MPDMLWRAWQAGMTGTLLCCRRGRDDFADLGGVPGDPRNAQIGNLLHHPLHHDATLFQVWHMRLHGAAQLLQLTGSRHLWAGLHYALHLLLPPVDLLLSLLGLQRIHTCQPLC